MTPDTLPRCGCELSGVPISDILASGIHPKMVASFDDGDITVFAEVDAVELQIGKRVKNFDAHLTLPDGTLRIVRFGDLKFVAGSHPSAVKLYNSRLFRLLRCREQTWGSLQVAFSGTSDIKARQEERSQFEREHDPL